MAARRGAAVASLLSPFALAVHGYHPYAEDGGLYVAGIKRVLDPSLDGPHAGFVTAPTRFSFFAPVVAEAVRATHLPLPWVLLTIYCASLWMTLYAGWMLASRCVGSTAGRVGAVALLACWLTLPIAGTSLMLIDPYVTARSFSTPLVLLALAWAVEGCRGQLDAWLLCGLSLLAAAFMHPLMAGYGLVAVVLVACAKSERRSTRRWGPFVLCGLALVLCICAQAAAPAETADYVRVAMTRYYWFPFRWQWYEQAGLIAPLAILFMMARRVNPMPPPLARVGLTLGVIALLVSILFARAGMATHMVARMQPLRCFQIVYEIMILLLGAWIGERSLRAQAWRWAALLAICGGTMFFVQRSTFPASDHLELPWRAPTNAWEQAFLWVREHTSKDAVFALDARYITRGPHEDAQCFRALAERDALPDYSKDGGEAAIAPWLTEAWVRGQAAQTGLEAESDAGRAAKVKPLGATWVVLQATSATAWSCPYQNPVVKVCRLP